MLNVKKTLTKILKSKVGWKSSVTATMPYTAAADGFMTVSVAPSSSSASYITVAEDGISCAKGFSTGGTGYSTGFPVIKGKTYTITSSSNVGTPSYQFRELNWGGVIRQLLSKFAMLFNREGVAVC